MMKLDIASADGWMAIYINGQLWWSGDDYVDFYHFLKRLRKDYPDTKLGDIKIKHKGEVDYNWLYDLGHYPRNIKDVVWE